MAQLEHVQDHFQLSAQRSEPYSKQRLSTNYLTVRVPVVIGHGESVYFKTTDTTLTVEQLKETLQTAPGVCAK